MSTEQLVKLGLKHIESLHYQSSPGELVQDTLRMGEGVLTDTLTARQDSDVTRAFGIEPLQEETSTSGTLGFVFSPGDRFSLTMDVFRIDIATRAVTAIDVGGEPLSNADGLVLPRFTLVGNEARTRLDLSGALSPASTDTLYAQVRGLPLEPITQRINPKFRFGGDISAEQNLKPKELPRFVQAHAEKLGLTIEDRAMTATARHRGLLAETSQRRLLLTTPRASVRRRSRRRPRASWAGPGR